MYLKNAPSKLQLHVRQINVNRRDTFYLKFILILQLGALDSPYFRMHTIFELTCLLFDKELIRIVHKFGVHPAYILNITTMKTYLSGDHFACVDKTATPSGGSY